MALRAFAHAYLSKQDLEASAGAIDQFLFDVQSAVPFMLLRFPRWHACWLARPELWTGGPLTGSSTAYVLNLVERCLALLESKMTDTKRQEVVEHGIVAA